ncbi:MAG TPA: asparagine synthase (glutamine-hydrolyzing) [Candidatus Acidoferrales bacterium]|nr:asparagine synthase (glutamine-hydrolyzing) [Candidatus Acidoferrales bacterium]
MCGIFGIASSARRGIDPDFLWFGTHRVRHRGPNDWGFVGLVPARDGLPPHRVWKFWGERQKACDYRVGFGSRRLSIQDLSIAGHQPMNLAGSELWTVFNGEIYNFLELRAELETEHTFATSTDTEVLLAAYQKWGAQCLLRLNGMFAFAIWDGARRKLFFARDRCGEKPFYYLHHADQIIFASELKQFLEDKDFDSEIDHSALADFLLFSLQDHDERTFFRHVKQLLPAHWMEWDADSGELRGPHRYWMPEIASDLDVSRDRQFAEELPSLLEDSIRLRLRSDVRVGICLSGGLDSTTICSIASSKVGDPASLAASTMAFPGAPEDELGLAASVARACGVRHIQSTMDATNLWDQFHQFVYFQDGPTGGASNLASLRIFEAARADGAVVLLNGQGGDELLAGYNKFFFFWLQILLARGHWVRFLGSAIPYLRKNGLNKWSYAEGRRYFPLFVRKRIMGMWQFSRPELRTHAAERIDVGSSESLNLRLWKDLSRFSLPCLLHWEDRNSMAVSTEARLPFLDHRLVEAVLSTSGYTKLKNGYTKYSLRCAMAGSLPSEVCWQKQKRGFDTPARRWFKSDLSEQMTELLTQKQSRLDEFVDTCQLARHYELFQRGEGDSLTESDWFKLVGTSIWLSQLKKTSFLALEPAMAAV